jgi:hypothetical protein
MSEVTIKAVSAERGLVDLTEVFSRGSLKSDIGQVADSFDCEFGYNSANPEFPTIPLDLGDTILVSDTETGEELFKGVIIEEERAGETVKRFTAFDPAWYLTKSKIVIQFGGPVVGISADQCIRKVVEQYGLPISYIRPMSTPIKEIYINKTGVEIIEAILAIVEEKSGGVYHYEMRKAGFHLDQREILPIEMKFYLSANDRESLALSIDDVVETVTRRRSIAETKNSVKVFFHYSTALSHWGDTFEAKDSVSIAKYGTLSEVIEEKAEKGVTIRLENKAAAVAAAQRMLAKMNRVFEDVSFECLGNSLARAGKSFPITEPVSGIDGLFLIRSCEHIFEGGVHKMRLSLVVDGDVR